MIFEELHNNLQSVIETLDDLIIDEVMEENEFIVSSIKDQLWDGQTGTGADIRPYYSEDPFFKTKKQAIGYKNWKAKITPNPRRNPDAPNLFINGYFYDTIGAKKNGIDLEIGSENTLGQEIESGHKDIFLLQDDKWDEIGERRIDNILNKIIDGITRI
jgi:hypothetical protein